MNIAVINAKDLFKYILKFFIIISIIFLLIVLNCSYLAMVEGKRIYKIIENRRNLLYNRLCN